MEVLLSQCMHSMAVTLAPGLAQLNNQMIRCYGIPNQVRRLSFAAPVIDA